MGARWYLTGNDTFSSRDSYAGVANNPVSLDNYAYAGDNPLTYTDPTGHTMCRYGHHWDECPQTYNPATHSTEYGSVGRGEPPPETQSCANGTCTVQYGYGHAHSYSYQQNSPPLEPSPICWCRPAAAPGPVPISSVAAALQAAGSFVASQLPHFHSTLSNAVWDGAQGVAKYFGDISNFAKDRKEFGDRSADYLNQLRALLAYGQTTAAERAQAGELIATLSAATTVLGQVSVSQDHIQLGSLTKAILGVDAVGSVGALINKSIQVGGLVEGGGDGSGESIVFYHGTSAYAADEAIERNAFNVEAILRVQAARGTAHDSGIYLTTQQDTAREFSNYNYGEGQSGGPAVLKIEVNRAQFTAFAKQAGIDVEAPHPDAPGVTETRIPFDAAEQFNDLAAFSLAEEGDDG
jgi:hypothetical protein